MARELFSWLLYGAGALRRYQLDPTYQWQRLVFVCEGNICRSAYAEWKAKSLGLPAASFGLSALDGNTADPRAIDMARCVGVDLKHHQSTHIGSFKPQTGDLILCMDYLQAQKISKTFGPRANHLALLPMLNGRVILPDPYGRSEDYFTQIFQQIDIAILALSQKKSG